jgi:DNA-binding SARP family transcriptional activator
MIELQVLRAFEVRRDGDVVSLPPSAQRLVAFLAVHERPVHRDHVSGNLWLESTGRQADTSLRATLRQLGREDCPLIDANGTLVRLEPDVAVDLHEARHRARAVLGRVGASAGDIDRLCLAGELLPGWYEDWVLVERERFRHLRLHALDALCEALTLAGRYAAAVVVGGAAVGAEPLRESAQRLLIQAHLAGGNRDEAVHQYREFRGLLASELGLAPSAQLTALVAPIPIR